MGGCLTRLLNGKGPTSAKYVVDKGPSDEINHDAAKNGVDTKGKLLNDFGPRDQEKEVIVGTSTYTPKKNSIPNYHTEDGDSVNVKDESKSGKPTNFSSEDEEINVDSNSGVVFFGNQGIEPKGSDLSKKDLPDVIQTKDNNTAGNTARSTSAQGLETLEKKDSGIGTTDSIISGFEAELTADQNNPSDGGSIGQADIEDIEISISQRDRGREVSDSCHNLLGNLDHIPTTDSEHVENSIDIEQVESENGKGDSGELGDTKEVAAENCDNKNQLCSDHVDHLEATSASSDKVKNVPIPKSDSVDSATASQSEALAQSGPSESRPRGQFLGGESVEEETPFHSEDSGVYIVEENNNAGTEPRNQNQTSEGGSDPAQQGAQLEDRFYNNKAFQKPDIDTSDPQQQEAALKIQTKYRQYHAKQVVDAKREEVAAVKIQAGYRGFHDRQKVKEMKENEGDEAEVAEPDIDVDDPEVQEAATKIQAQFKGYQARKQVQEMKDKKEQGNSAISNNDEEIDIDLNDPEVGAAAVKIQASFKGFKARKELKENMDKKDQGSSANSNNDEEIDIDLNDPEVGAAAVKIQASFKGFKARKELKEKMDDQPTGEEPEGATVEEEVVVQESIIAVESAPEVEAAAPTSQETEPQETEQQETEPQETEPQETEPKEVVQEEKIDEPEAETQAEVQEAVQEAEVVQGVEAESPPTPVEESKEQEDEAPPPPAEESGEQQSQEEPAGDTQEEVEEKPAEPLDEAKQEEPIDIDLDDPEVAAAATKIQASFKGYKVRKDVAAMKEDSAEPSDQPADQSEEPVGQTEDQGSVEQPADQSEEPESSDKPAEEPGESQATEGEMQVENQAGDASDKAQEEEGKPAEAENEQTDKQIDIDTSNPEMEKAATKIQATFKGYKTRKEFNERKQTASGNEPPASEQTETKDEESAAQEPEGAGDQ